MTNFTKSLPFASKSFTIFINNYDRPKVDSKDAFGVFVEMPLFYFEYLLVPPEKRKPSNAHLAKDLRLNVAYSHLPIDQILSLVNIYTSIYHDRYEISRTKINWSVSDIDNYLFTHYYSILYFHYNQLTYKEVFAILSYARYTQHVHRELLLDLLERHPVHSQTAHNILKEISLLS